MREWQSWDGVLYQAGRQGACYPIAANSATKPLRHRKRGAKYKRGLWKNNPNTYHISAQDRLPPQHELLAVPEHAGDCEGFQGFLGGVVHPAVQSCLWGIGSIIYNRFLGIWVCFTLGKPSSERGPAERLDLVWCRHELSTHTCGVQPQRLLKRLYLLTSTVLSNICVCMKINNWFSCSLR